MHWPCTFIPRRRRWREGKNKANGQSDTRQINWISWITIYDVPKKVCFVTVRRRRRSCNNIVPCLHMHTRYDNIVTPYLIYVNRLPSSQISWSIKLPIRFIQSEDLDMNIYIYWICMSRAFTHLRPCVCCVCTFMLRKPQGERKTKETASLWPNANYYYYFVFMSLNIQD